MRAYLGEKFYSVEWVQFDIGDDEIDGDFLDYLERLVCTIAAEDFQPVGSKVLCRPIQIVMIRIDQK